VQLKYYSFHPCIYPAMIRAASPDAAPGRVVFVYDRDGQPFGQGLYNPKARVPLRVFVHGAEPVGEDYFVQLMDRALDLRLHHLRLPEVTDAFRVIHSDGDGLSGLVVDRFGDVLSIELHSLGMFQRLPGWLPHLHQRLGTRRTVVEVDDHIARIEGIRDADKLSDEVRSVRIREHGVRYEVNFAEGHKTGFFCDQRENRRRFAGFVKGARVLDLCCYTGGFALAAKVLGGAEDVTGVDLDEKAIAQARRNANLNQVRVEWVHVDAFSFARQMQTNTRLWDAVVADPPKLIHSRDDAQEGWRRYEDLNGLALYLVKPGGLFVTCSCSGLLSAEEFEQIVIRAAHRVQRRLQIFDRTGAGPDHPMMSNCPESRYLKVIWARVF
jgi:23S rRNA (cytosine1962-C5)-methyltransferase